MMRASWTGLVLAISALAATAAAADDTRPLDASLPPLRGLDAEEMRALEPAPPHKRTALPKPHQVVSPPTVRREPAPRPQDRSDVTVDSAPEIVDAPAPANTRSDFNWGNMPAGEAPAMSQPLAPQAGILRRSANDFSAPSHSKALRVPTIAAAPGYKPAKVDGAPLLLGVARAARPEVRARKTDRPIVVASWLAIAICTFVLIRHLTKHLKARRRPAV